MSDWQPIGTAPKDGTPILAFCLPRHIGSEKLMGFSYQAVVWWRGNKFPQSQWPWRVNHSDSAAEPTFWQPLPEPPTP